jgi:hypothetical protein
MYCKVCFKVIRLLQVSHERAVVDVINFYIKYGQLGCNNYFLNHLLYTVFSQIIHTSDNGVWYEDNASSSFHGPVIKTEKGFEQSCPLNTISTFINMYLYPSTILHITKEALKVHYHY